MCTGFPRLGLLRRLRPAPDRSVDGGPNRTDALAGRRCSRTGTVPMFTAIRSTKEEPDFAPAASPRLPRSTSPWPPCGKCEPAREFPDHSNSQGCTAPGHIRQVQAGSVIKGRITPVPRVLLSVTLTEPTPSDGAGASRLGRGRFHPSWHLPGQAAPSFLTPAASGTRAKVSHLHSNHSASWRTAMFTNSPLMMVQAEADHRRHAIIGQVIADLKNSDLAHLPSGSSPRTGPWRASERKVPLGTRGTCFKPAPR